MDVDPVSADIFFADIVNGGYVGMVDRCQKPSFVEQLLVNSAARKSSWVKNFEGDSAFQLLVSRQIDRAAAALP